jgi:hypothetical protein
MRKLMLEQRRRVEELISSIQEETGGYKLGKPWRHNQHSLTCVVPILKTTKDSKREYITLTEAKKVVITDTGKINEALVKNNEDIPIFIRLGEILSGNTQERAVTSSRIVLPNQEVTIPVACIHASKGIRAGTVLSFNGFAPNKEYSYIYNVHNYGQANQKDSWNLDHTYTAYANTVLNKHGFVASSVGKSLYSDQFKVATEQMNVFDIQSTSDTGAYNIYSTTTSNPTYTRTEGTSASTSVGYYQLLDHSVIPTDDLTSKHKEVNDLLADIIKKVPLFKNQIGLILIDPDGFKCLDCYDVKLSYKAVKEMLIEKETVAISDTDEQNVFEYKPAAAKKVITKILSNKFEENIVHEDKQTKTITLDLEGYVGEAVLFNNKIVHLIITRNE